MANTPSANRIDQLDWLRGLMALSILIYHSSAFTGLGWADNSSSVLAKLGVYGVSIFFILSGLSMAHVYNSSLRNVRAIVVFAIRRVLRIWPLLSLCVALVSLAAWRHGHPYEATTIGLNMTGLFGFVAPADYLNVGAWSIGNEMVFYALTPAVIAAYSRDVSWGNAVIAIAAAIGLWFCFVGLDASQPLARQWATYVNPANNLFLYTAGVALYYNAKDVRLPSSWRLPVVAIPIILFCIWPSPGGEIALVTGIGRIAMSLISVAVVFAFYKGMPDNRSKILRPLEWLGLISYGLYLLHPFAISAIIKFGARAILGPGEFVLTVAVTTGLWASLTYIFLERPASRLGKRITRGKAIIPGARAFRLFSPDLRAAPLPVSDQQEFDGEPDPAQ